MGTKYFMVISQQPVSVSKQVTANTPDSAMPAAVALFVFVLVMVFFLERSNSAKARVESLERCYRLKSVYRKQG